MSAASLMDWAVQTGLAVSILIVFILFIRRPFARYFGAQAAYALWLLPLIRIFMPEITLPAFRQAVPQFVPDMSGLVILTENTPVAVAQSLNISVLFIGIWLAVAVIWFTFQIIRQRAFIKALRLKSDIAPHTLSSIAHRAAIRLRLKNLPELRISQDNSGPLVTGILRPVILLPKGFETRFTPTQQFFALTHEMAHIKRRDLWAALAALAFRTLNWPNPLVHMAARKFRADQEAACDAAVLKAMGGGTHHAHDYAETLVQAAKASNNPGDIVPLGLTIHHPLKERLMTLTTPKTKAGLLQRTAVLATLMGALAISTPITFAAGHPDGDVKVTTKDKSKQVIKWVEENDGERMEKHFEIIMEDGETKAFEIDENGRKTEVDVADIKAHNGFEMMEWDDGQATVMGHDGNVVIKRLRKDMGGEAYGGSEQKKVIIKRMKKGADGQVFAFSTDDNMEINIDKGNYSFSGGDHVKTLVETAKHLLEEAENASNSDDLSFSAQRKLKKAREALKEASEALAAEDK